MMIVLLVAGLLAAATAAPVRLQADCVQSSLLSQSVQSFPSQFRMISSIPSSEVNGLTEVVVAKDFSVSYSDNYKIVTNKRQGETYVLYQCGTDRPAASLIPQGAKVFEVPLMSVSVSDTTILGFMKDLGVLDRVAYTSPYSVDSCMQSLGAGSCNLLAMDPSTWGINQTLLSAQASNIDAFMGYSASSNAKSIAVTATPDPGVMNRAEWVKYVSLFFNKEAEANAQFATVNKTYEAVKAKAVAAAPADPSKRPLVAYLFYQPANPSWGPVYGKGSLQISTAAYKAQYAQDAGGRILDATQLNATYGDGSSVVLMGTSLYLYDLTGNAPALLRQMLADVDLVVDETKYPDVRNVDVTLDTFMKAFGFNTSDISTLKFLKSSRILREDGVTNPDSWTAWFEGAVAHPEEVLAELALALNPSLALVPTVLTLKAQGSTSYRYFRMLGSEQAQLASAAQCPLPGCKMTAAAICPYVQQACNGTAVYASLDNRCAVPSCPKPSPSTNTTSPPKATDDHSAAGMVSLTVGPLLMAVVAALVMALLV